MSSKTSSPLVPPKKRTREPQQDEIVIDDDDEQSDHHRGGVDANKTTSDDEKQSEKSSSSSKTTTGGEGDSVAIKAATEYYNRAVDRCEAAHKAKQEAEALLKKTTSEFEKAAQDKHEARLYLLKVGGKTTDDDDEDDDDGQKMETSPEESSEDDAAPPPPEQVPAETNLARVVSSSSADDSSSRRALSTNVSGGALSQMTQRMRIGGPLPGWYVGTVNARKQRHGRGVMQYDDGRVYIGTFLNNKMHGRGKCTWPDGAVYEGEFVNGIPSSSMTAPSASVSTTSPAASAMALPMTRPPARRSSDSEAMALLPPTTSLVRRTSANSELEALATSAMLRLHAQQQEGTSGATTSALTAAASTSSSSSLRPPALASAVSDTYVSEARRKRMRLLGGEVNHRVMNQNLYGPLHQEYSSTGNVESLILNAQNEYTKMQQQMSEGASSSLPLQQQHRATDAQIMQQYLFVPPQIANGDQQPQLTTNQARRSSSQETAVPLPPGNASTSTVFPLSGPHDAQRLSKFLCFVRQHCVEVFCATDDDVKTRFACNKIQIDQCGIRCRFCAHKPHKDRTSRSSSYPTSVSRLYQSLTMMIRDHFGACPAMPDNVRAYYLSLKERTTQSQNDAMMYWIESAKALGLVDTPNGIRLASMLEEEDYVQAAAAAKPDAVMSNKNA